MEYKEVILRCTVELDAIDTFVDALLAYPGHQLKVVSYKVQTHHLNLDDIKERVSGFKEQMAFEITLDKQQLDKINDYLQQRLPNLKFERQIIPLLNG